MHRTYLTISFLQIFLTSTAQELNNVLVIVTRYFGGILLGPDRFKHINQAARNALELGGFLDSPEVPSSAGQGGKGNARGRKR